MWTREVHSNFDLSYNSKNSAIHFCVTSSAQCNLRMPIEVAECWLPFVWHVSKHISRIDPSQRWIVLITPIVDCWHHGLLYRFPIEYFTPRCLQACVWSDQSCHLLDIQQWSCNDDGCFLHLNRLQNIKTSTTMKLCTGMNLFRNRMESRRIILPALSIKRYDRAQMMSNVRFCHVLGRLSGSYRDCY